MTTPREEARAEFDTLAREIAGRIINVTAPKLKHKYDKGAKRPYEVVVLPATVSRELYEKSRHDLDLIDEIGIMIFEIAKERLKTVLGENCESVSIQRNGDGALTPGDKLELAVLANFS